MRWCYDEVKKAVAALLAFSFLYRVREEEEEIDVMKLQTSG